eukprot:scaffold218497_cov22-Prasinocladus_malaysianus.AAC.2
MANYRPAGDMKDHKKKTTPTPPGRRSPGAKASAAPAYPSRRLGGASMNPNWPARRNAGVQGAN